MIAFTIASLLFSSAMIPALGQEEIIGRWVGGLEVANGTVPMVVRIWSEDGELQATVGSTGNPMAFTASSVTFADGELEIVLPDVSGGYTGTLQEDGTIQGTFSQNGQEQTLNLERSEQ